MALCEILEVNLSLNTHLFLVAYLLNLYIEEILKVTELCTLCKRAQKSILFSLIICVAFISKWLKKKKKAT